MYSMTSATENAGRSNQFCFTSLDLFPQLGCKLAAALHRFAGKVNVACCKGKYLFGGEGVSALAL